MLTVYVSRSHAVILLLTRSVSKDGQSPPKARSFCDRLGYTERDPNGGVDFSLFPEFQGISDSDSEDFPAGVWHSASHHKLGITRIGLFSEYAHPTLCAARPEA